MKKIIILKLEQRPEISGFNSLTGYIYIIQETLRSSSYKIGYGDPNRRLTTLNIGSSQKSLIIINTFISKNVKCAEKMIHLLMEPFKIKKRNEWSPSLNLTVSGSLCSQLKTDSFKYFYIFLMSSKFDNIKNYYIKKH